VVQPANPRLQSSRANKAAADKVWRAIQDKEKQGAAKLKIPVKVVSATKDTILAASTDENQQANKPDLQVTMAAPLVRPPAVGSHIDIIGVLTDYIPAPFVFIMKHGELAAPSKTATAPRAAPRVTPNSILGP